MRPYLASRWIITGLLLVLFGWGPLLAIILASWLGLLSDPNPNPIGPGLLFMVTAWPAIICLAVGVVRTRKAIREGTLDARFMPVPRAPGEPQFPWLGHPAVRLAAGAFGVMLMLRGVVALRTEGGRPAAAGIVVGAAVVWWAATGRGPAWFRR